jgi:uridine kinase
MKLCFLISGISRTFLNNLHPFFIELIKLIDFDVYINFADNSNDTLYSNTNFNFEILNKFPFYKSTIVSRDINFNKLSKENNTLNQWFRLYNLFKSTTNNYDLYIRIRTDIKILIQPLHFIELLNNINNNVISIPNGYDFYNSYNLTNNTDICINDQLAIANYDNMKLYSEFYTFLTNKKDKIDKIESEKDLYSYLTSINAKIERIILPYKIILSECKVISIAGDSGSGKTTLMKSLEQLFIFDNYILLETDRYHKWERNSDNWKKYTHLNPEANHLEKMSEDIFRLKLGETILNVDYDHSTGKFTSPEKIESKPYILLCGLHTLYKENIRNISEIKIFLDTQKDLKKQWKIQRDVYERNKDINNIINSIQERESDYYKYIEPQKYFSDIIIQYINETELIIYINDDLNYFTNTFLSQISSLNYKENKFNKYIINKHICNDIFKLFINNSTILNKLSNYPLNIIQTIIYLCLFKE